MAAQACLAPKFATRERYDMAVLADIILAAAALITLFQLAAKYRLA